MVEVTERALERMPAGRLFAMRPHMQAITLEVIRRAIFGARAGEFERLRGLLATMLDRTAKPAGLLMLALLGPSSASMRRLSRRELAPLDAELYRLIAERRVAADLDERDDVLSLLLLARDEDGVGLTDAELRDELVTLLVAGHETTATSLAWAFERLARHPEMFDRLVADEPYRDAVVKETLRLRPVIAVVLRTLTEPMEVAGRLLPAGAKVVPGILLVHRRADLYPEPQAFRPERLLNGCGPGTYGWIPFGGGVRRCLGAAFAQMEMSVVLQTVAGRVQLEAVGRVRARAPSRDHLRPRSRGRGATRRRPLASRATMAPPQLYPQRDQPPGVPPLVLDGERTLPDVPEENYWFQRHLVVYEWIAARAGGLRVVDMASGEGYGSAVLARSATAVVGVEANPDAFEHARLRYAARNLRFEHGMVEVHAEPCDAVVFLQTIEHVQDPGAVLEHFKTMLAPGGVAYVSTPNVLTLAPAGEERSGNPWHLREYRPEEFRALCEAHFATVEVHGLFHARKLAVHQTAIERLGWDAVHARLGITRRFYDRFVPAISVRDFALRADRDLARALDFVAVLRA